MAMPKAAQQWITTDKGRHLRGRVRTGTQPELALRRALFARGWRFRVNHLITPGCRPDVAFTRLRIAVFVDGCFWHSCPEHGRSAFDGPNAALWEAKMIRNAAADARANREAGEHGWRVFRTWECQVGEQGLRELLIELESARRLADSQA